MSDAPAPEDCTTMAEVREGVDAVDLAVVTLLKRRFGYMEAAARIKPDRSHVRDEWRKADVLAKVQAEAERLGVPDRLIVGTIYEQLIEASIAFEDREWTRLRADQPG